MPYHWKPGQKKNRHKTYPKLMQPVNVSLPDLTPLTSGSNRPLQMTFEDQINILVYFHLEEHKSGRHLLQILKEDHFARQYVAPEKGIQKSSFFEDISSRGLEQMLELFEKLYVKAARQLPKGHAELGDLTIIDGSLIDAVLSMYWADYRDGSNSSVRSSPPEKQGSWIATISAIRASITGRQRENTLSVASRLPPKGTKSERTMFSQGVLSSTTPWFCWGPHPSIKQRKRFVSSVIESQTSITGSPQTAMISPPSKSPSPISCGGISRSSSIGGSVT